MSALALIPLKDHPDARLFELVASQEEEREAWEACTNGKQRAAHMRERRGECARLRAEMIDINARQAITMEGLIAKAEHCLHEWREDDGPDRFSRMWSGMAMALEQAIATLQASPVTLPVVRVVRDEPIVPGVRRRRRA